MPSDHAHVRAARSVQPERVVHSTIVFDAPLAHTTYALAQLARRPPDTAVLRVHLAAANAALETFDAALAHPLAEIDAPAHRAYLAALVLMCTLAALPADMTSCRHTTTRMLELFERFASPRDRALRARLTSVRTDRHRETSSDDATFGMSGR
jgi:hypothetical protein